MRILLLVILSFPLIGCSRIDTPPPPIQKPPLPNPLPSYTGNVVQSGSIHESSGEIPTTETIVETSGSLSSTSGSGEDTNLETADTILNPKEKEQE